MSEWCWANRYPNSRCSRNCWHRKNSDNDRRRYDYIWVASVFLELRSFKYLYPPRAHEELAGGRKKGQAYNKKVKRNKCYYHKFYFYMCRLVVIPHCLDLAEGKQDFGFHWKMSQNESDKVNAAQDSSGTTGIKLICMLCGKVAQNTKF